MILVSGIELSMGRATKRSLTRFFCWMRTNRVVWKNDKKYLMSKPFRSDNAQIRKTTEEIHGHLHLVLNDIAHTCPDGGLQECIDGQLIEYIQRRKGWHPIGENGFSYKNGIKVVVDSYRFSNAFETVLNIGKELLRAELEGLIKESANKGDEIRRALKEFESKDWTAAFVRRIVSEK